MKINSNQNPNNPNNPNKFNNKPDKSHSSPRPCQREIREIMEGDARTLQNFLLGEKTSIAFAESCTGGQLSGLFTLLPGASKVFQGAVVSYSNRVKRELLQVSEKSLQKKGAVSEDVARQMARGVAQALGSDYAISITGIAGPGGGSDEKPIGTVCFALFCARDSRHVSCIQYFQGERRVIQEVAVSYALSFFLSEFVSQGFNK